jgi:hypothetical protein
MTTGYWIAATVVLAFAAIAFLAKPLARWMSAREVDRAIREFRIRRESLEAKFVELASRLGKPRGLIWKECDWQESVTFAREVPTGLLTAFAGVEIHFEAIAGGDMEEVEAVSTIRDASAVFHYQAGNWGTGGKALFNMNPTDALKRLAGQFHAVQESAQSC